MLSRTFLLFFFLVALGILGCKPDSKAPVAGGMAEKPKVESELAVTTLSRKAVEALEIKTEKVTMQDIDECLSLTGWIMARPGQEVTLTAPVAGIVSFDSMDKVPVAGRKVDVDQEL